MTLPAGPAEPFLFIHTAHTHQPPTMSLPALLCSRDTVVKKGEVSGLVYLVLPCLRYTILLSCLFPAAQLQIHTARQPFPLWVPCFSPVSLLTTVLIPLFFLETFLFVPSLTTVFPFQSSSTFSRSERRGMFPDSFYLHFEGENWFMFIACLLVAPL